MKHARLLHLFRTSLLRKESRKLGRVCCAVICGFFVLSSLPAADKPVAYQAWKPKLEGERVIDVLGSTLIAQSDENGSYRVHTRSGEVIGPFDSIEGYYMEGNEVHVDGRRYDEGDFFYRVDGAGKVYERSLEVPEFEEEADGDEEEGGEHIVQSFYPLDSRQLPLFIVEKDDSYFVVQGSERHGPFDYISEESLKFAANGKSYGFIYSKNDTSILQFAGKDINLPGDVVYWTPAPDGSAPWVWVTTDDGFVLFHGDKPYSTTWEHIFASEGYPLVFDPSGKIPAYCASDGENSWVVAGQKKLVSFLSGSPRLQWPSGYDAPWYAVRLGSTWTLVAGKKKYEASFSDDSISWFIPRPGNLAPLWVSSERVLGSSTFHEGDLALVTSDNTQDIVVSSDGKRYALIVMGEYSGMDAVIYGNRFVMVSNKPGTKLEKYGPFTMADNLEITPDGKVVSFSHGDSGTEHSVIVSSKLYAGRPDTNGVIVFDGEKVIRIVP